MPAIKNNPTRERLSRLRELIRSASQTLFTCSSTRRPVPIQPLSDSFVDTNGSIWFFTDDLLIPASDEQHRAQLFYANTSDMVYLSVSGKGSVISDEATIKKIRQKAHTKPGAAATQRLIRIKPLSAFYWSARTGILSPILREGTGTTG